VQPQNRFGIPSEPRFRFRFGFYRKSQFRFQNRPSPTRWRQKMTIFAARTILLRPEDYNRRMPTINWMSSQWRCASNSSREIYNLYFTVNVRLEDNLTYVRISIVLGNFVQIKKTLINSLLHCQSTLHGVQSWAPWLLLRLLNTIPHTVNIH